MIPDAYYDSIYDINYEKLKDKNYKNLFFDVDNTLLKYNEELVNNKTKEFINNLKNDFNIIIVSNSGSKRIKKIVKDLDVLGYYFSMKPLNKVYKKILKKYNRDESIFIGDQFMTDIKGAKKNNFKVILVNRLDNNEPLTTRINRYFENRKIKKYIKKNIFDINKFYDNL